MVYGTHRDYRGVPDHASGSFRDLDLVVESSARTLEKVVDDFDAIVVTGISGLSVGAPLALRLKKPLLVVRKTTDVKSHGTPGELLGAEPSHQRLLFLDDFIGTATTLGAVEESITRANLSSMRRGERIPFMGRVVGTYEYRDDRYGARVR